MRQLAFDWGMKPGIELQAGLYCQNKDDFQARLNKMRILLVKSGFDEQYAYYIEAIAGEIGNNSFDHNLGSWADVVGVLFAYEILNGRAIIYMADRGQGILATLQKVKPELASDAEALQVAFTEKITSRFPENRGNGLKFVRDGVSNNKLHLEFYSGNARALLNEKMDINETDVIMRGCLAILEI